MRIWLAVAVFAAAACTGARAARRLEGRYTLASPGADWRSIPAGGADHAWFNDSLGASIYADSNCGKHFEDGVLDDLSTHLTAGIASGAPLREERLILADRDALLRISDGALDGVPVRIGSVVLNKDACTYDLVMVSPPGEFEAGWKDFVAMALTLTTRGRSKR